ncbi:hypothetical protein [Corynebacterium faecale]|uniref:hypothetical protein n=1 Tax=Corynebacterium faecale TaxID=1758466 RepID=UPI0025B29E5E|nr:hypothetical protein [Corynebacterium faecale]
MAVLLEQFLSVKTCNTGSQTPLVAPLTKTSGAGDCPPVEKQIISLVQTIDAGNINNRAVT